MKPILTASLVLITAISFAQNPPAKYEKIWNGINGDDPEGGRKELMKIIKTKPKDPWPYWMMGIALSHMQSNDDECTYYEQAIAVDSAFTPAYYNLGSCLERIPANFPRIEKLYNKAIELEPDDNHHYIARASLYQDWQKYDQAIKDCKMAKLIESQDCYFANQIIIQSLYAQGKMDDLKIFLRLNDPNNGGGPPDGEYQFFLGELYENWGEPQKACPYFKQAVEDTEFMLDILDPGVLDKQLEQYRAKVKAVCQ